MTHLTLSDNADLDLIFDIEAARLGPARIAQLNLTKETFIAAITAHAYPTLGFCADGRAIGGLILMGDELHMAVAPDYHGKWHALWKPAMKWLFSRLHTVYGYTEAENMRCQRFMEKNGWHCLGAVEKYAIPCVGYRMTADEIREKYGFSASGLTSPDAKAEK